MSNLVFAKSLRAATCLLLLLSAILAGCDSREGSPGNRAGSALAGAGTGSFSDPLLSDTVIADLVQQYLDQVSLDIQQAIDSAAALNSAVDLFLADAETARLEQLRQLWLAAHTDYEATALHRYFFQQLMNHSNSGLDLGLSLDRLHFQINYWPILPGYIDYLSDYPGSGVVGDMTLPLNPESILQQHGAYDLAEALLGFHPLEFLLWGENTTPGVNLRPASDYLAVTQLTAEQLDEGLQLIQLDNNRRRVLLDLVSDHLVDDLRAIQQLWSRNQVTLRTIIDSLGSTGDIRLLLDAITAQLSDEILVRSLYPMLNGDFQGSHQSPYSHSSENAVIAQLASVERLLLTTGSNDLSLEAMLSILDPEFSAAFFLNFDSSKACLARLYASAPPSSDPRQSIQTEFATVECINQVANMINTVERMKQSIP